MNKEYFDYLKFVDDALRLAKSIPRYFSKFSNKIYCNHQKFAILILMQKLKTTTRGIVAILRASSELKLRLGLHKVPVHTTIVRFAKRIGKYITRIFNIKKARNVAVDSTGFELESKSYYYRNIKNSDKKQKTKQFMKLSICTDTDNLYILKCRIRKKLRNDNVDFVPTLNGLEVERVFADKGYDSKKNRQYVLNKLKALPIIPKRGYSNFYGYIRGKRKINGKDYHQRSKVETVFSMIKRKYGSVLRGRSFKTQKTELLTKLIAHNIELLQKFLFIIRGLH